MTVNDTIKTALAPLSCPIKPDGYDGPEMTYITFNYSSRGANFADNAPKHEIYAVQVHYFCSIKTTSMETRKAIKHRLFTAGFTWPEVVDASDKTGQHWVFECECLMGVT